MMRLVLIVLVLLSVLTVPAYGQVPVSSLTQGKFIGKSLEIFRSPKKLRIQEVVGRGGFAAATQDVPRYGYTYDDVWARLGVENSSSEIKEIFFEFRGPIEGVEAYLVIGDTVVDTEKAGMFMLPEDESSVIGHSYPVVKFNIPPGLSTLYFSETAVAPHFPMIAYDSAGFKNRIRTHTSVLSSLFGSCIAFLFVLLIICLFVNAASKVFLITGFLSFFTSIGFITGMFRALYFNYGGQKESFLAGYLYLYSFWPLFLSLYFLSLSLFSISHLGKDYFFGTKTSKVLTSIALLSQCLLGVVSVFDTVLAMKIFSFGFNITIFQSVYWTFKKYKLGKHEELFTILGWLIFSTVTSAQILYFHGFSDYLLFSVGGAIFGFFSIFILFTISLIEKNRRDLLQVLLESSNYQRKLEFATAMGDLATQVAHDIRSPLAALGVVLSSDSNFSPETRNLVEASRQKIDAIANQLLSKARKSYNSNAVVAVTGPLEKVVLSDLIESTIAEKRVEYKNLAEIKIEVKIEKAAVSYFTSCDPLQFGRLLSNLINNSIESIEKVGVVIVLLRITRGTPKDSLKLEIVDTGMGISETVLKRLGDRGATFGKQTGSGFGLFYARNKIELWGGTLEIHSTLGKGTTVSIELPIC